MEHLGSLLGWLRSLVSLMVSILKLVRMDKNNAIIHRSPGISDFCRTGIEFPSLESRPCMLHDATKIPELYTPLYNTYSTYNTQHPPNQKRFIYSNDRRILKSHFNQLIATP